MYAENRKIALVSKNKRGFCFLVPCTENALFFGSIFDFLKNTPQADLSGCEVPPGAKGVCNGLNMARNAQNKYLKKKLGHEVTFWVMTKKFPKKFFRCFWVPHAEKHPKTQ